jgi:hypothetical protein
VSMIDEGRLVDALGEAANAFEISTEATDRILSQARASQPGPRLSRAPVLLRQGRGRLILMAAVLILVVGAISWPLLRLEGGPSPSVSAQHSAAGLSVQGTGSQGAASPKAGGTPAYGPALGSKTVVTNTSVAATALTIAPKIESSGSVALTVGSGKVETAFEKLSELATGDGGSVVSTQANVGTKASGKFSYGTVVLQVPQRTFTTLVGQVQRVGHATSIVTTSNDVTGQYVDLRARITALDASRQQYLVIMTHATSIGDILAVQSRLNDLQSQIEQLQGQMNLLNAQTTYSTLSVDVTEAGQHSHPAHKSSGLSKAWHDAIGGFVAGFEWLVRLSGPVLFALLCLGALSALGRLAWRALRRRRI